MKMKNNQKGQVRIKIEDIINFTNFESLQTYINNLFKEQKEDLIKKFEEIIDKIMNKRINWNIDAQIISDVVKRKVVGKNYNKIKEEIKQKLKKLK